MGLLWHYGDLFASSSSSAPAEPKTGHVEATGSLAGEVQVEIGEHHEHDGAHDDVAIGGFSVDLVLVDKDAGNRDGKDDSDDEDIQDGVHVGPS